MVRCMDKVFGKKDVEAKYIPLDISKKAMQYLPTLAPAHLLSPLIVIDTSLKIRINVVRLSGNSAMK